MDVDLQRTSDTTLVLAIARYREDALAELYRRHAGAVFALAQRLLASRPAAEEITQEVFLKLWNDPDRFDPERGTLRALLLTWTHGRAVDTLRSDVARRRREDRSAPRAAPSCSALEDEAIDLTIADHVHRAVTALRPEERTAIALAYYEGLTYREVAERLQQPEGTIKSRIRSGLRSLRVSLSEHVEGAW